MEEPSTSGVASAPMVKEDGTPVIARENTGEDHWHPRDMGSTAMPTDILVEDTRMLAEELGTPRKQEEE